VKNRTTGDWGRPAHSDPVRVTAPTSQVKPREPRSFGRRASMGSMWPLRSVAFGCAVAILMGLGGIIAAFTHGRAAASAPIPLGIVGANGHYFADEETAGLQLAMIGVSWATAEPSPGKFNDSYLTSIRTDISNARADSLGVVLDPGLQYPPSWVFSLPGGTRFVNQYGDVYIQAAASGNDVANAVTNPAVRAAEATFLRALSARIPGTMLSAVRTGGGPDGQLSYPGNTYSGHTDSFWAYDASSQAVSPVPGWTPGTGTTAQASAFLTAYNHQINAYGRWLDTQMATDFNTRQLIMLPGWGERPGVTSTEVSSLLTLGYDEFSQGLDWAGLLPSLPNRAQLVAYSTYLDAPSVHQTAQLEDPMAYIAHVAKPLSIPTGGENTGHGSKATLKLIVQRALKLHLTMVNWMDETQVVASSDGQRPAGPTFADLAAAAKSLR
jgi:hypothetical protein